MKLVGLLKKRQQEYEQQIDDKLKGNDQIQQESEQFHYNLHKEMQLIEQEHKQKKARKKPTSPMSPKESEGEEEEQDNSA